MTEKKPTKMECSFAIYKKLHKVSILQAAYRLHEEGIMQFDKIAEAVPDYGDIDLEGKTLLVGSFFNTHDDVVEKLYPECWERVKHLIPDSTVYETELKEDLERNSIDE